MTKKEIERILDLPDTKTPLGLRDRCILELLYATGIRSLEQGAEGRWEKLSIINDQCSIIIYQLPVTNYQD